MKINDIVMFVDEGRYAKWFFGQLGIVKHFTKVGLDGKSHCRVEWLTPVPYHGQLSTVSDFAADKFNMMNDNIK